MKTCPICKIAKPLSEYDHYYSKARQKMRPQNYCKECQGPEKRKRSKAYYETNKERRKKYAVEYRANPENKDKLKKTNQRFKKKYREELKSCYVADQLAQKQNMTVAEVRSVPGLVEVYAAKLKLVRTIRQIQNATK